MTLPSPSPPRTSLRAAGPLLLAPLQPDGRDPRSDTEPGTPGGLRVHLAPAGPGVTVVSVAGAIDLATAAVFATALTDTVTATGDGGRVVLELDRVTFLAAHGLGIIAAAHAEARRGGVAVVLVADQVGPAAVSLRFLQPGHRPVTYRTLTAALAATGPS